MTARTFDEDVAFLRRHTSIEQLTSRAGACLAVAPEWQGRAMTSAFGSNERSFGFLNRPFIESGRHGTAFDNYGGEDRFWLGPEAGQFGFYFAPGAPFDLPSWQVPHALQQGAWRVERRADDEISFARELSLRNHSGAKLDFLITRTLRLLDPGAVRARFGVALGASRAVAFESVNRIANAGSNGWQRETGLPSIWILGQFPTSPDALVVIPLVAGEGPPVNDTYFGKVPRNRLAVREGDGYLVFRADGRHRSKIGVAPARTRPVCGSYSAAANLLTVVRYDKPELARDYVNSAWELQKEPYAGDVVNSYNDGPVGDTAPLAPFYELETSSPAADLAPGDTLTHAHATLHVVANLQTLEPIAQSALGVTLEDLDRGLI